MQYYSTNNRSNKVSFRTAVMQGLANDGGLYMPESVPRLNADFLQNLKQQSILDIAYAILSLYITEDIPTNKLQEIITLVFNFPVSLVSLSKDIKILELFHGPTLSFKDFGARFAARVMEYFVTQLNQDLTILVATSGDTGSAVANGFYNIEGINVYILYPKGKVSSYQEQQFTTYAGNITALEIAGTFDDCQKIVKQAFLDQEINNKLNLSSANSINIARLLPQAIYYFEAYKQLKDNNEELIFSVPSGNLGNLTAGLLAKKMGLPVSQFIGATNSNNVFTDFINTGNFSPRASHTTLSNAMDVGNPSNLARIQALYANNVPEIQADITSSSYDDVQTIAAIKEVHNNYDYIMDPHGAVGYLALQDFIAANKQQDHPGIVLETAHPAKFVETVAKALDKKIDIPDRLAECLTKEKKSIELTNKFEDVKEYLL